MEQFPHLVEAGSQFWFWLQKLPPRGGRVKIAIACRVIQYLR